jgi:hypothetical protein
MATGTKNSFHRAEIVLSQAEMILSKESMRGFEVKV